MAASIEKELRERIAHLAPALQREVLAYVERIAAAPSPRHSPRELLRYVGCIEPRDLDLMHEAIEDDCERVDRDGW